MMPVKFTYRTLTFKRRAIRLHYIDEMLVDATWRGKSIRGKLRDHEWKWLIDNHSRPKAR